MRAIGYVRDSTEEQALTGVSLDAQEEKIRAYCVAKDWDLINHSKPPALPEDSQSLTVPGVMITSDL